MKNYKDLMEDTKNAIFTEQMTAENQMSPQVIELLKKFSDQVSSAFQKDPPAFMQRIEKELNKYGYTLGPLDDTVDSEISNEYVEEPEHLMIFTYGTRELVKNAYFELQIKHLGSEQQFVLRPDGAALSIRVRLRLLTATTEEFDEFFADDLADDASED